MAKTNFTDGNIATKTGGTRLLAAWLNKVFRHRHDGRDQDGSAPHDFAADSGAVNAIVAAMTPAFDTLIVGVPFYVQVAQTNSAAVTVTVDGFGPHPLHKLGGLALAAGDIHATQIVQIAWDGTNFQLLSYNSPPVTDATTLQGQGANMLAPPGIKGEFFMPSVPPGWLPCDGRLVLRAQYPALFAAIGTTWSAGDNVSTFGIPEVRGEYFRAWDNGRGVDPSRAFGSWQEDAMQNITGTITPNGGAAGDATGAFLPDGGAVIALSSATFGGGKIITFDASRQVRTANENRVRNIALLVGIKF